MHLGDEKKMAFRKDMTANSEFSATYPIDSSFQGVSSDDPNKLHYDAEEHKKLIKGILGGIVDGSLRPAFKYVGFTWTKPNAPEFTTVMDPAYVQQKENE